MMDKSHIEGPIHLDSNIIENQDTSRSPTRDGLPAKNMAIEEHRVYRFGASFDDLPFELVEEALSYLDDYKDLINIMCASRLAYSVFKAVPQRLQTRIALNIVEPKALQMALAAFYCVSGSEACIPYISVPKIAHRRLKREPPNCPPFEFPFQFPFPTQQSEIARFLFLYKLIKSVAERLVSKSRASNTRVPNWYKVLSADSVDCLTAEERGGLEKKLFQYQLVATALNHDSHRAYNNLRRYDLALFTSSPHRWLADFLLENIGSLEFQQLLTVESLILDDYWTWERKFQTSFIDEILEATQKAKAFSLDPSGDSSQKVNCNMKLHMINIRLALAIEDVANPVDRLDYIYEGYYQSTRAYEWDCFLATLQTFGLKWYEEMWAAPIAKQNKLMLHAHKTHENIRRFPDIGRISTLRNSNIQGWGVSSRYYPPESEQIRYPDTHIERYLKKAANRLRELRKSVRSGGWLFRTRRWPWDDAHLLRMNLKHHCVFGRRTSHEELNNAYYDAASPYVAKHETNPPTAIDLVGERDELPISVWMNIIGKYQMDGARVD
ncbi:hypothetical protein GGR58DRAFT_528984 [Xylaria digitata]|nr:hypothetical protein GGR58DRAFT_528984 [Xylaria digitata]